MKTFRQWLADKNLIQEVDFLNGSLSLPDKTPKIKPRKITLLGMKKQKKNKKS